MSSNPLTRSQITARMKLVIEEKYPTYKADIGSSVEPLRYAQTGPLGMPPGTPAVGIYYERHTTEDAPQTTGEYREARYMVEAFVEVADFGKESETQKANDVADALEWTLKNESQLLHPTSGEKLAWLFRTYIAEPEIRWLHKSGRTSGMAYIRIPVRVVIDENLTY